MKITEIFLYKINNIYNLIYYMNNIYNKYNVIK